MTTWIKPNGVELELNDEDATIKEAMNLGWKTEAMEDSELDEIDELGELDEFDEFDETDPE